MRQRILLAIVGVTAMATILLTVPLVVVISRRQSSNSIRELERIAQRTMAELSISFGSSGDAVEFPKVEADVQIGVYRPDGTRVAGTGPPRADAVTARVKRLVGSGTIGDQRVLADPVIVNERLVAVVRVAEPTSETAARIRRDVLILIAFDLGAILAAGAVGWIVAARLARPVRTIRDDAVRLGDGDFSIVPHRSGVSELDETAQALADTARRLDDTLSRERAFSADASHQLRTPLASLRLLVETEAIDPRPDPREVLADALIELDRLEATVATLLAVARDRPTERVPLDVGRLLFDLNRRWNGRLASSNRPFRSSAAGPVGAHISQAVLEQILEILIANAVDHGTGTVSVIVEDLAGAMVVTVQDEGHLDRDPSELFTRRDPGATGHGVGLSLARTLAEAEGGRLVLVAASPTTFRLVLPDMSPAPSPV